MIKSFKVWIEQRRDQELRQTKEQLLDNLGLDPKSKDGLYQKIEPTLGKERVIDAIKRMGLDTEKVEKLEGWINEYPHSMLKQLLNQIVPTDIPDQDETGDAEMPGQPGKLPTEQPLGRIQPQTQPQIDMTGTQTL